MMRLMRWTLAGCLLVSLAGCGTPSSQKPAASPSGNPPPQATNKEKIVGTWEMTKGGGDVPAGTTFEFTKDGKTKMSMKAGDKTMNFEGTYTVEGDKLNTVNKSPDGKEQKETDTIVKLTESEMVIKDPKDKTIEFKKKK